jgi:hypothetical protein
LPCRGGVEVVSSKERSPIRLVTDRADDAKTDDRKKNRIAQNAHGESLLFLFCGDQSLTFFAADVIVTVVALEDVKVLF